MSCCKLSSEIRCPCIYNSLVSASINSQIFSIIRSISCSIDQSLYRVFRLRRNHWFIITGLAAIACAAHLLRVELVCVIPSTPLWVESIKHAWITVAISNFCTSREEICIFASGVLDSVAILIGGFNSGTKVQRVQVINDPTALPATDSNVLVLVIGVILISVLWAVTI